MAFSAWVLMMSACANASHGVSTTWPPNAFASGETEMFSALRLLETDPQVPPPAMTNTAPAMIASRPETGRRGCSAAPMVDGVSSGARSGPVFPAPGASRAVPRGASSDGVGPVRDLGHESRHSSGIATSTSARSERSRGRLRPTTPWWSPSMPLDEGSAEPVDGERARHRQRLAGRDVGVDLRVGPGRRTGPSSTRSPRASAGTSRLAPSASARCAARPPAAHRRQRSPASTASTGLP